MSDRPSEHLSLILDGRAEGKPIEKIADEIGISRTHAFRLMQGAIADARVENSLRVQQRAYEHDLRCELLYSLAIEHAIRVSKAGDFSPDAVRLALSVLERQAKLWGLDRKTEKGKNGMADWSDKASLDDLIREAKRLGVTVPEKFSVGEEK